MKLNRCNYKLIFSNIYLKKSSSGVCLVDMFLGCCDLVNWQLG
jgi:hypothetical protein